MDAIIISQILFRILLKIGIFLFFKLAEASNEINEPFNFSNPRFKTILCSNSSEEES